MFIKSLEFPASLPFLDLPRNNKPQLSWNHDTLVIQITLPDNVVVSLYQKVDYKYQSLPGTKFKREWTTTWTMLISGQELVLCDEPRALGETTVENASKVYPKLKSTMRQLRESWQILRVLFNLD